MVTTEKPGPGTTVAEPPSLGARLKTWAERAYLRPGSRPFALVADLTVFLVLSSLVLMVLESVPAFEEQYGTLFFVIETVVVLLFTADYVANIVIRPDRRAYVLGIWGLIDLLAILPYFLTLTNLTGLRAGRTVRTLRTLRALRVLKLARIVTVDTDTAQEETRPSFWRDIQMALIGACSLIALAQVLLSWEGEQLFWLVVGGGAAVSLALRRWCVERGLYPLSILLVFAGLALGVAAAMAADAAGESGKAGAVAIVAVLFTMASVLMVEGPTGTL